MSFTDARAVRTPHGAIVVDDQHVADTLQCVHCNAQWIVRRGSGIVRGFCRNCMGPVCGPTCAACRPFEQWLDAVERRRA